MTDLQEIKKWFLAAWDVLFEISSKEFQEHCWLRTEGPFASSWEDCLCGFDDVNTDELIDGSSLWKAVGLPEKDRQAFLRFRDLFKTYCKETPSLMEPKEVLSDEKWVVLRNSAQKLREVFWPIYKQFCKDLLYDEDEKMKESTLCRIWIPSKIVDKFIEDPSPKVAESAKNTLENQKLLEEWHKDTDFMNGKD